MSGETRGSASSAIEATLEARFPPGLSGVVGGYWPTQGEFDVLPYLRRVVEAGGAVALPLVETRGAPLRYRLWTPQAPMEIGRWDILHPAEGPEATPDLLLVPLVGFDAAGHRLGYGGGYFDRTLARLKPRPIAVGLGFELGRLATLAPQVHDQPMDLIITERGPFSQHYR